MKLTDLERAGAALVRWNAARLDAEYLRTSRNALECERVTAAWGAQLAAIEAGEPAPHDGQPPEPCWKRYDDIMFEGTLRDDATWCASCRRRYELHCEYRLAMRRRGALMRAMQRKAADASVSP